ncbi:MAG: SpoIVB peptidase S55 domain-containing protein [bacterium]
MMFRKVITIFVFLYFAAESFAGDKIMPLSEIQPGMRGVAKTVFAGNKIEEFDLEILDIIPNFRAKRSLILAKLIGDKVEKTGVVAGMSGSPVYIDGKLIGALSYRMGIFLKDPIAGITPIEEMLEITEREKYRSQELASNRGFDSKYLEMAVGVRETAWENFIPAKFQKLKSIHTNASGISPLKLPLIFSGFENSIMELSAQIFDGLGFEMLQSGGTISTTKEKNYDQLQPGSAFSLVIVEGDFGIQATGTVTYTDGDRVLGMGHPVFDSGAVGLPMGRAKIVTTVSSLMASTKISAHTDIVGTLHQDRTTGVLGVSGEMPKLIPVRMNLNSEFQEPVDFNFRLAEDRSIHSLTPLIFRIVLFNAIESARLSSGDQTLLLEGQIKLRGKQNILLQNFFAGGLPSTLVTDALEATGEISAILGSLLSNNFELPKIESINLNFTSLHKKNLATVQRVEIDKSVVKPGDEITLAVTLKEYQGQEQRIRHSLRIPNDVTSKRISVFAGSGSALTQVEYRSAPQKFRPNSFNQLLELLKKRRKNNFLFFQIRLRDKGVLIKGEELPSLPPSIRAVMNSQKSSGNVISLRDRTLIEDSIQVNYSISGGRTVWLNVEPKDE